MEFSITFERDSGNKNSFFPIDVYLQGSLYRFILYCPDKTKGDKFEIYFNRFNKYGGEIYKNFHPRKVFSDNKGKFFTLSKKKIRFSIED